MTVLWLAIAELLFSLIHFVVAVSALAMADSFASLCWHMQQRQAGGGTTSGNASDEAASLRVKFGDVVDAVNPIHLAAMGDEVASVQLLLAAGVSPALRCRGVGFNALHCAAACGALRVLDVLLAPGQSSLTVAPLNATSETGGTALMLAVRGQQWPAALRLAAAAGVDLNARDADGYTALLLACREAGLRTAARKACLSHRCDNDDALCLVVGALLRDAACATAVDTFGNTALHHALLVPDQILLPECGPQLLDRAGRLCGPSAAVAFMLSAGGCDFAAPNCIGAAATDLMPLATAVAISRIHKMREVLQKRQWASLAALHGLPIDTVAVACGIAPTDANAVLLAFVDTAGGFVGAVWDPAGPGQRLAGRWPLVVLLALLAALAGAAAVQIML
jgi:ankyrin repeat protein